MKPKHTFCAMKVDDGPCKAMIRSYFFNIFTYQCEEFIYGGCRGNENRFETLEECKETCIRGYKKKTVKTPSGAEKPDFCFLEEDPGICRGLITRYFYNNQSKQCEQFKYGGCLGNRNNFETLDECKSICEDTGNELQTDNYTPDLNTANNTLIPQSTKTPSRWGPYDDTPTCATNCQNFGLSNMQVSCKVSQFIHLYLMGCNYFWMLCEGIYLHTLIVVAVFAEKQHLTWYYFLGWGFPLLPACIHAIARSLYYNDNCWISSDTHLLYIIHGPICAALLVNLFFLLNIVRVLITKLKVTHQAESNLYMKAVRATLILVPLLGIEFVLFPWRPEGRVAEEVYDYVMHILMHYQVQAILRRNWNQYKIQFGNGFSHSDALRSASYTVSTISDIPGYSHDCPTEHLNGKSIQDIENVTLKPEKMYDIVM
ncbi:Calcitonin gene-related peptide type 1 receptor [Cricetulus griseus]|uniref:Calcitonin gene-related peptide type 1 receptor n=1 Tax=Cricetulus griseus TaxID=10029 RepID=G3HRJ5_CRIGR|nr:Calcitonin gene-related peptide type 1 receptor [Cricetulus griseus]